ncbi:hypothetical protein [Brevundimonas sp.]|uniref:hypothetical protein n=1 Tax=Brevundimonas sp. TaxID=1871086 RepID=UPI002737C02F|nr:hypothetical protein [Brevundimonas sp.]MDP3802275.1 hypothetical protein [Brevundimonas sp.]
MILPALFAMMSLQAPAPEPPARLTFLHGDETLATWLEASTPRQGDRVRARVLRVRKGVQPFWLVLETDCAAGTSALIAAKNIRPEDSAPPPFEGEAWHRPLRPYDRLGRALQAAVCDGRVPHPGTPPAPGVEAAMAAALPLSAQAIRQRPLELIVARSGPAAVLVDRATLDGGGPQWEVRSLKRTGEDGRGVWSWWEVDCSWRRTADLQWSAPARADGGYGPRTEDAGPARPVTAGSDEAAVLDVACAPDIWSRPASDSIGTASGPHQRRSSSRQ